MVTIADVARRAGVAPSTVSYVLSNRRSISPSTRRVVEQAIEELDYQPHAGARALRGARTRVLALSGHWVPGPFRSVSGQFVHLLAQAARAYDNDLLLLTGEESIKGLGRVAGSRLADGAVLMSVLTDEPRIDVLCSSGFPAALLGRPRDPRGLPWCDFDFEEASAMAVRELARAGHRHIAFLASTDGEFRDGLNYAPRALAGARAAARAGGVGLSVARSSESHPALTRRLTALLNADPRPTGLVVHHGSSLLMGILRESGYSVPAELSVVIVGSTQGATGELPMARIPLPIREMTSAAVDLALAEVERAEVERAVAEQVEEPAGAGEAARVRSGSGEYRLIQPRLVRGRGIAAPAGPRQ